MKKLLYLFVAVASVTTTFGQPSLKLVKNTVGNDDILRNWRIGEVKYLDDISVQRIAGANDADHRTNLFYTSNKGIMNEIETASNEKMVSDEWKNERITYALFDAPGGQLSLFFDRNNENLADPSLFELIVRNEDGTIVYCKSLEAAKPYYYRWGIWYYYATIDLPVNVGKRFVVDVVDAGLKSNYRFVVVNMNYPDEMRNDCLICQVD